MSDGGAGEGAAKALIAVADQVRERAYAPYSGFRVGAAVETANHIYGGANVENVAYPTGLCAEQAAIAASVAAEGPRPRILRIAISAVDSAGVTVPCAPCGACRQFILEFGAGIRVLFRSGPAWAEVTAADLLPHAFGIPGTHPRQ